MNDASPQRRAPPTYLMFLLIGGLVLAVTVLVRLVSEGRLQQIVPQSVPGHLAVIVTAMLAAIVLAAVGRRWLNRLSATLMGVIGSAFVVTLAPSLPALVVGCLAGAVVAFSWLNFLRRGLFTVLIGLAWVLPFTALGVLGGGVARSLAINSGRSHWIGPAVATAVFVAGQLVVLGLLLANRLRRSRAKYGRPRVLLTCAMLIPLVLLIPVYWQLGWYGEMIRRLRKMQSQGVTLAYDWQKPSWERILWRGPMIPMQFHSQPAHPWHWATVHDLAPIADLTLFGPELTDENLAMDTWPCSAFQVSLQDTQVTGKIFEDKTRFPRLMSVSIYDSPVNDEGLRNLSRCDGLSWIRLIKTRVTESGLTHLSNLESLTTLSLQLDSIGPTGFSHLAQVKSLRHLVIISETKITGLQNVAAMTQLVELHLHSPVDAVELQHVQNCPALVLLEVRIESLSPEMIAVLQKLQAKRVKLRITTLSSADADTLKQLFPRQQVLIVGP